MLYRGARYSQVYVLDTLGTPLVAVYDSIHDAAPATGNACVPLGALSRVTHCYILITSRLESKYVDHVLKCHMLDTRWIHVAFKMYPGCDAETWHILDVLNI